MAIDPAITHDPARERLTALIAFSSKRLDRCDDKLREIQSQRDEAVRQLDEDRKALRQYDIDNPPAQPDLF